MTYWESVQMCDKCQENIPYSESCIGVSIPREVCEEHQEIAKYRNLTLPELVTALVEILEEANRSGEMFYTKNCVDELQTAKPLWTELKRRME